MIFRWISPDRVFALVVGHFVGLLPSCLGRGMSARHSTLQGPGQFLSFFSAQCT